MTTTVADKRRAGRLMKEARTLTLDLINEDIYAARHIAYRAYPLVEYAAHITPVEYSPAEKERAWARFWETLAQLETVTEAR